TCTPKDMKAGIVEFTQAELKNLNILLKTIENKIVNEKEEDFSDDGTVALHYEDDEDDWADPKDDQFNF
ncbi:hypothetical protein, partial [Romboutsia sp.]|uniref:hypothetical protein n=1 Tax=Romboutsia sp. TaxID=1965302 RepID=UPI003F2F39D8